MNSLLKSEESEDPDPEPDPSSDPDRRKRSGKSGKKGSSGKRSSGGSVGGFLISALSELFVRQNQSERSEQLGAALPGTGDPIDGMLTPDYCLFRPLDHNGEIRNLYWPEYII
jgi:hypothetical protein